MSDTTLIIHGWSDTAASFREIKKFLVNERIGTVETILYADYESREDNITFNDVIDGLNDRLIERGIIDRNGTKLKDVNIIVHSTGGLVVRHWIWRYYWKNGNRISDCPVKRLVMLAPANFGSPLAHRGKSFLGALFKGRWKIGDLFEVGRRLLDGLELASPYQWALAHRDLFIETPYYNSSQIQVTVLVGVEDYEGLRGWVNKPGTDGTVVIAGTPVNAAKLVLDFAKPANSGAPYEPSEWARTNPPSDFAFGVLPGLDHGSIVGDITASRKTLAGKILLQALQTQSASEFADLRASLDEITAATYKQSGKPAYQQFLLHAIDDQGESVRDFTLEFFLFNRARKVTRGVVRSDTASDAERKLSQQVNALLLGEVHTHSQDPSYRRLLVDIAGIKRFIQSARKELGGDLVLSLRMYVPRVDKGIFYNLDNLQNVVVYDPAHEEASDLKFFFPNTTTLIELQVDRCNEYVHVGTEPARR